MPEEIDKNKAEDNFVPKLSTHTKNSNPKKVEEFNAYVEANEEAGKGPLTEEKAKVIKEVSVYLFGESSSINTVDELVQNGRLKKSGKVRLKNKQIQPLETKPGFHQTAVVEFTENAIKNFKTPAEKTRWQKFWAFFGIEI